MSTQIKDGSTLFEFIDEHARTSLELKLLCFWSKYPNAKFTSGAIAGVIDHRRRADLDLERALEKFVRSGLIERHAEKGVLYRLTADSRKRDYVLQLSACAGTIRGHLSDSTWRVSPMDPAGIRWRPGQ